MLLISPPCRDNAGTTRAFRPTAVPISQQPKAQTVPILPAVRKTPVPTRLALAKSCDRLHGGGILTFCGGGELLGLPRSARCAKLTYATLRTGSNASQSWLVARPPQDKAASNTYHPPRPLDVAARCSLSSMSTLAIISQVSYAPSYSLHLLLPSCTTIAEDLCCDKMARLCATDLSLP